MKKTLAVLLAGVLSVSMLAGCGSPSASNSSASAASAAASTGSATASSQGEPTKISVMCHASWRNDGNKAAFDYVEKKMNVKFEFEEEPEGDAGEQLIFAKISTGDAPDILWWQPASMANVKMGADKFEDVSGDWMKNYDANALKTPAYTINGKTISTAFGDASVFGMCYNKKVFSDNGVAIPKTWDDLLKACATFKAKSITPVYLSGKDAWTLQIMMLDGIGKDYKSDSTMIDKMDTNKLKWTGLSTTKTTLNNMKSMVDKGFVQESYLSDTYADAQNALLDGTAAMYPMASYIGPELAKITTDKDKLNNMGMFAIPGKTADAPATMGTPTGFYVPSASKNKDLAKKIVNELSSKDAAQAMYKVQSGIPFIKDVDGGAVGIMKDASTIINAGNVVVDPSNMTKYQKGALETYIQDMLVGNRDSNGVLSELDNDFTKQAKDAKDTNWSK